MTRVKKLTLAVLTALALAAGAVAATSASSGAELAGDPSQWGVAKKGSFDITGGAGSKQIVLLAGEDGAPMATSGNPR